MGAARAATREGNRLVTRGPEGAPEAKALVVVPTYNEAENLEPLVAAVLAHAGFHVLIVDDNSPDGTGDLAERLKAQYPGRLDVLHRTGKLGLGTAYVAGFRYALARDYTHVIEMDCDFSHPPEALPRLIEAAQHADVVVGSRYVPGGSTPGWPLSRRIISRGGSIYTQLVLGIGVRDTTAGFICLRREVLATLDLDAFQASGFGFQIELKWRCHRKGFRIAEVPITFVDRKAGQSKMSTAIFLEGMGLVWRLRLGGGAGKKGALIA
jgi:dolichol-phosphate mannosyltransferase